MLFTTTERAASISFPWRADILALLRAVVDKNRRAMPKTDRTDEDAERYRVDCRYKIQNNNKENEVTQENVHSHVDRLGLTA